MTEIVRSLIEILSAPSLRALIITHLGDLMSAMLQVIHAGVLKKPVKNASGEIVNNSNADAKTFVMTDEWYEKLLKDRNEFKLIYQKLIEDIYKPLVIKELLILLAPTKSISNGEVIRPPLWLKRAISNQLTGYLVSPGGVSLVMRAMCDSTSDAVDWHKAEVLAKLISTVQGNLSDEEFYSKISPQVISLLNMTGLYCVPVAKNCIRNIYQHNPAICNKYIFSKLFEIFTMCSKPVSENFKGTLVSEDSLSKCIDQLSKCFAPGSKESAIPMSVLTIIIKIMYKLYMKVAKSAYQHKAALQDLLIEFLYSEKDIKNLTTIYNALIFKEPHKDMLEMSNDLEFQFGPSGGVQVGKCQNKSDRAFLESEFQLEFETTGDHMLDLLSHRREYSKKMLSDLFVIFLSALSDFHDHKIEMSNSNPDILSVDELIVFLVKISQKRIITIKLLAVLAENVQVMETIQEKPEIVFKFVQNLLDLKAKDILHGKELKETEEGQEEGERDPVEDSTKDDAEDIFVALAVVDLITINIKSNSGRWDTCKLLLISLEVIRKNCQDPNVKYYSDLLYNRISTHGAVSGSKKPQVRPFSSEKLFNMGSGHIKADKKEITSADNYNVREKSKKNKKLIVELDGRGNEKSEFDIVVEEICSEDVPTRGHALIQLEKLIKKRDAQTLSKREYIFVVLKCNLKHEDTYIYLSAINALEALGNLQDPDRILELLCEEYTNHKKDSSEIQMKIGEVLMRITRGLGEMAPKYKALLINTFLFGTKSTDELLRVSSLSNLGELLRLLGYSVGSIVHEVSKTNQLNQSPHHRKSITVRKKMFQIFVCVKAIATTDKSVLARRAAVMVIKFLLKEIEVDTFMVGCDGEALISAFVLI